MSNETIDESFISSSQKDQGAPLETAILSESSTFEIALSNEQMEFIQSLLPKGYALKKSKETTKRQYSNPPNKKIHLNDGGATKIEKMPQFEPKNIVQNLDPAPPLPTLNSSNSRSLRHKSSKINYEKKYADMETSPITSSMKNLKNANEGLKKAFKILIALKKNLNAEPFLRPVDPIALNIPDYFTIIKEPMDLGTVEKNLLNGVYKSHLEFASDVRKIWSNSFLYNAKGSVVYYMTCEMSNLFEKLYKDVEKRAPHDNINELQKKIEQLSKELNALSSNSMQKPLSKQSSSLKSYHNYSYKPNSIETKGSNQQNMDKPMTLSEKKNLGQNIRKLPAEYLRGVWEIVCDGTNLAQDKEELEFDIETLPARKVRELERYVKSKLKVVAKANIRKTKRNNDVKKRGSEQNNQFKKTTEVNSIGNSNSSETTNLPNNLINDQKLVMDNYYQMPIENKAINNYPRGDIQTQIYQADNVEIMNDNEKSSDSSFITDSSESDQENFGE